MNLNPWYILAVTGTRRHVIMMHFGNGDKPNVMTFLATMCICWEYFVLCTNALLLILHKQNVWVAVCSRF